MGAKTLRVYFNTGFNGIDIPGTPAVVGLASHADYPDIYFLREDYDLPIIKVRDSYDNLKDVDYVRITDNTTQKASYYFATPHAEAKSTTVLALVLDALLTMGGAENLTYSSGWIERGHISKEEDTLFSNVAPENFEPSRPLIVDAWSKVDSSKSNEEWYNIVVSNVDLGKLAKTPTLDPQNAVQVFAGFSSTSTEPDMYLPTVPAPSGSTIFEVADPDNSSAMHRFNLPNTCAYNANGIDIRLGISKLHSMGQFQLMASYKLPRKWCEDISFSGVDERADTISGISQSVLLVSHPYEYAESGTIKNKKCYALFRTANIISLATGDRTSAPIYDIFSPDDEAYPKLYIWSDPSSTGKPYACFAHLNAGGAGSTGILHPYARAVKGSQWNSSQIVLEGAAGSAWNSLNAAFSKSALAMQYEQTIINNNLTSRNLQERTALQTEIHRNFGTNKGAEAAGIVAEGMGVFSTPGKVDYGAAIRTGSDAVRFAVNLHADQMRDALALNELIRQGEALQSTIDIQRRQNIQANNEIGAGLMKANTVAPSVCFTPEINLGLYGYNYFAYFETRLNVNDLHELDEYFQRYGYNGIHKPLTGAAIKTRQYYNYVQATGINIKNTAGMRVRELGISQLNSGVRIWHVLPDSSYYQLN